MLTRYARVETRQDYIGPKLTQRYSFHRIANGFNAKRRADAPQLSRLNYRFEFSDIARRYVLRL
jgi:hypothetical protein